MGNRLFNPEVLPYYDPSKDRKVAVITGGNSGIGWYTVLHLYMHGFVVYILGRNSSKVQQAIDDIDAKARKRYDQKEFVDDGEHSLGEMKYIHIDLTELKSVEKAVKKFYKLESQLDVLINNAAVMAMPFEQTKDGFEIQLQTNYISHFLLTLRLLPLLEKTNGRIITLSSLGHKLQFKYWPLSEKWDYKPNMIFTWVRYAMAKTALIQFTKMLAIKHPNVLCVSMHPGLVMNTNLFSYWTRLPIVGIFFWMLFQIVGYFFGVSNEEGSMATIRCALSTNFNLDTDNGKYYTTGGIESRPSYIANNLDDAASTWIWTVHELRDRGFVVA